jgi:general secretion pathway protein C
MLSGVARNLSTNASTVQVVLARVATLVTVLLLVFLAERMAVLTWLLIPEPDVAAPELAGESTGLSQTAQTDARKYNNIASMHLFGERRVAPEKPKEVVKEPEVVPETKLQLTLKGVYHTEDTQWARAIIAGRENREDIYAIGDSMPGGVTLEGIETKRVVLSRQGKFEALSFPEGKKLQGVEVLPNSLEPVSRSTQPGQSVDVAALAERYRTAVASDPTALADIAQVQPFIEQGTFRGFRLRPGRKRSLLRQLGLRSGDVVTSVNGMPLNSMSQAMDSLRTLGQASEINVIVLRDGIEVPFSFRLN